MAAITTEERVAVLEAIQEDMREDLREIKTNHLPHIEQKIDSLRNWIMGALLTGCLSLFALTANLVVKFL
jgi:hypothetical protein